MHHRFHEFFPQRGHGRHEHSHSRDAWLAATGADDAGSPPSGQGGRGGHGGRHGGGHDGHHGRGGHHGGRGPRVFEQGALKLLSLHLLAERPCHGYEVIKAIGELVGGEYSPSPGVIYPTLAYLADLGLVAVTEDGARKQYAITPAGQAQLDSQRAELDLLLARLRSTRQEASARGAPEIQRAMGNLKMALQMRFANGTPDKALIQQVAALIDQAAVGIERL